MYAVEIINQNFGWFCNLRLCLIKNTHGHLIIAQLCHFSSGHLVWGRYQVLSQKAQVQGEVINQWWQSQVLDDVESQVSEVVTQCKSKLFDLSLHPCYIQGHQ